jgi:GAF domain-containing protein
MTQKYTDYKNILAQVSSITSGESDLIANMANISAILFHQMHDVNWAGFYLCKEQELVLGPFQGQVACIRIPFAKGVCGTCASTQKSIVVDNVHNFAGHIACDVASNAEVVCPIVRNGKLIGVLDIDSPELGRFTQDDRLHLEKVVDILVATLDD